MGSKATRERAERRLYAKKKRGCYSKVTYMTRKEARADAKRLKMEQKRILHPYKCQYCNLFHLTSQPK